MIHSRFDFKYKDNASKGHKLIGEILRTSPYFKNYISYQEWPVSKINSSWKSNREHFDWVVPQLKLVIEYHGRQHAQPVCFGGVSQEQAEENFVNQQLRDQAKAQSANEAGWVLVVVWPETEVTDTWILNQYQEGLKFTSREAPKKVSQFPKQDKLKAAAYRKAQYQKQKEWKKKHVL